LTLAIFDLDNTLLKGDSDHAWGEFLVDAGLVDPVVHKEKNDRFYQQYEDGTLDIFDYQEFVLSFLSQHPMEQLHRWQRDFMHQWVEPIILPAAEELLKQHRSQGDHLMIISATNEFITHPIAVRLGVDTLIATGAEIRDGRYTGKVEGVPSFQDGKVTRLNHWLKQNHESLDGAWFYSDSHNDLPLLKLVDNPVAVDPDETLRNYAESHDWSIISLRT
jgi:HAD superfamily hydrolase (TIGR01490 family)